MKAMIEATVPGYKTYMTAAMTAAWAVAGAYLGKHDMNHAWELLLIAMGMVGLRAGMGK